MDNFYDRLTAVSAQNNSRLCIGLDPSLSNQVGVWDTTTILNLNKAIIESTIHIACAYKPNLAIYESMGCTGLDILEETMFFIHDLHPSMPIIGDAKRGDIGQCAQAYVQTMFGHFNFDAVTVNPYMGSDSLEPFLARQDRGVFILCRTSNPGASDIQDLVVLDERDCRHKPLYEFVASMAVHEWNDNGNVGLVVGATAPDQMMHVRQVAPDLLFLIPGIGPQGGDLDNAVANAVDARGGGFIITASRQIMHAAQTYDRSHKISLEDRKNIENTAKKIQDGINRALK